MKSLKPTIHDAETVLGVFASGMLAFLSSSTTPSRSLMYSAVIAGLAAVVHHFLPTSKD